jgi:quinol monooxygenase YgiN
MPRKNAWEAGIVTTIGKDSAVATVMVRFSVQPADVERLLEMSRRVMPLFAVQPGFVSANLHVSQDRTELVQYLQWLSAADHYACMANEQFQQAGEEMMDLVMAGRLGMEMHVYEVVGTWDAAAGGEAGQG